jgi:protein-S-isoprenylcysteine O-methyltransferase Ste14
MNSLRRILITIFVLLLVADFLFGIMAIGTGHKIPKETSMSILVAALVLIGLIILAHKYLKAKKEN